MKTLLVDDIRDVAADIICRNYEAAVTLSTSLWLYEWRLLLDHDLGPGKTGYDFINHLITEKNMPKEVFIVSSNPVGRDNIGRALEAEGYVKKSPQEYIRQ